MIKSKDVQAKAQQILLSSIGFVFGLCVVILGGNLLARLLAPSRKQVEAMRVHSPDHKLDAVLVEDSSGGAVSGICWYVYVVQTGQVVPSGSTKRLLFFADELTKGRIVWNKPHLVEIHYDKASIMAFSNISTVYENEAEYVELRLVPSSEYSLVTPEGGFRSDN